MAVEVSIKKDFGKFILDVEFHSRSRRIGILGASGSGKTDLGPLPVTAKVLLGCLAAAWVLILVWLFVGRMKRINEKRL